MCSRVFKLSTSEMEDRIPTEEIKKDIQDTVDEIAVLEQKLPAYRTLFEADRQDRMSYMRFKACEFGIKDRKEFVEQLQLILEQRK